jgi:GNAT superfamily N-acetyltransferase
MEKIEDGLYETVKGSVDWEVMADLLSIDEDGNEIYSDDYVRINNLFVHPEFRGHGVARNLMEKSIAKIEADYPGMKIKIVAEPKEADVDCSRLATFYASLGLEVVAF